MRQHESLEKVILPVVNGLGLQWVGLQYFPQGKKSIVRLFVEKDGGITVDDCQRVSRQVDAVLTIESPLLHDYVLEVSSPGFDRILFSPQQCGGHIGKLVSIRLVIPINGKKNFRGRLHQVEGEKITIVAPEGEVTFSFSDMDEVRLVPEWVGLSKGSKK